MSAHLQLLLLLFNFFYGFIICIVASINYKLIKNEVKILKVLITLLASLDFTFLYLVCIFKINSGIFHIYYLLSFSLGFVFCKYVKNRVKFLAFLKKIIDTLKKR